MARQKGFEPLTRGLEGRCSGPLSYWRDGRGDWIRTSDPLRPRQVRYQAAPRPDITSLCLPPSGGEKAREGREADTLTTTHRAGKQLRRLLLPHR